MLAESGVLQNTVRRAWCVTECVTLRGVLGVPFTRVFASDLDDPESPNSHLSYSLVNQIPNKHSTPFFQINTETGEISTTEEGTTRTHTHTHTLSLTHTHKSGG